MERRIAGVDTSCLIGLAQVQLVSLPLQLYTEVMLPPAVHAEYGDLPAGYVARSPRDRTLVQSLCLQLGCGEAEVIALGLELVQGGEWCEVILDDLQARQVALDLNLHVVGTIGLLVRAKQGGYIDSVRTVLEQLRASGFYCSAMLYRKALELAKEVDPEDVF